LNAYSKNIIFVDTEFSSLDPYKGEILSVGLVKTGGEELYLELEFDGEVDDWPRKNILPTLKHKKHSREEAAEKITEFVGKGKPYAVAYVNQFDMVYLYKLFGGTEKSPFHWMPIDFATLLFCAGIDPESYDRGDKSGFFARIRIDPSKYKKHNALDDARLLRETYLKLIKQES